MKSFVLFSLFACALTSMGNGVDSSKRSGFRHGPGHRPLFFDKVALAAREQYVDNMFDVEKPRYQIIEDELEWGKTNGIEEDVRDFQKARADFYNDHGDKVTKAIKKLPETYVKMRSYFKDLSLSHTERERAIHRLFKSMTPELRALMQATRAFNIDKLANGDLFPSHKRRQAMRETLLKDDQSL
ncbi:hypothetical protein PENTCL1PPCAC_16475 [Pristionchus entomophagus]|uniref:SXP/RAL-2 family protein Ani s 5-like cation-binding domain-containing protein n=1 Tax=Pristionchus entomophagus TaxID=358040 RepID=A0AAV5TIW1_9BILA|nr:hypothetical protein PENTCL1PPCAC_16475 [Pristionchus entomophagus]